MHRTFISTAGIAVFIGVAVFTHSSFARGNAQPISDGREFGCTSCGLNSQMAFQVVSDMTLRQVVNSAIGRIDQIARSHTSPSQKLTAIRAEYEKVRIYRARNWSRSPATELKLDYQIRPYESFPEAAEFRKQNCSYYYNTLKVDWEPEATGAPTLKGVKRAWENLRAICGGA